MFGIGKYHFKQFTEDTIIFKTGFTGRKLRVNSKFIDGIYVHRIHGKLHQYKIMTRIKQFSIPKENLELDNIKAFAIKNDITLIEEEIYHGGKQIILHQSSKTG